MIPVRCDQTGSVPSKCCSRSAPPTSRPASTPPRRSEPSGPELIVDAWGEALVAFAWQCVLGLVTGIAAATGKDARGNLLVPVEIVADAARRRDRADGAPPLRRLERPEARRARRRDEAPRMAVGKGDLGILGNLAVALGIFTPGGSPEPRLVRRPRGVAEDDAGEHRAARAR